MNIEEFERLVFINGVDLNIWPEEVRQDAKTFAENSAEATAIISREKQLNVALDKFIVGVPSTNLKEKIMESIEQGGKPETAQDDNVVQLSSKKKFYLPVIGTALAACVALVVIFLPGEELAPLKNGKELAKVEANITEAPVIIAAKVETTPTPLAVAELPEEEDAELDEFILSLVEEEDFEEELLAQL